jgi:hypothetical protein
MNNLYVLERNQAYWDQIITVTVVAETEEEARKITYQYVSKEENEAQAQAFLDEDNSRCVLVDLNKKGVIMVGHELGDCYYNGSK